MEEKTFEQLLDELNTKAREYGYYYISDIELIGKHGDFETVTRRKQKLIF